ncbi:hypothetical protein OF829_07470 [Sphingomonas sp. LB-2]|uniref:hypothetical protein n=1 Tax=Sphingomonas caeni TaxID=2984949 RepID=UPI00222F67F3|nr:hypothetical protein [Sphingomonas caeni]MCW3847074.1 hypothetical protein [Sphingomonas caeni]
MEEEFRRLSSNKIAAGISFAALVESFAAMLVLKELGAFDQAKHDPLLVMAASIGGSVAIALAFGMPLALKRLRDPRLRHRDWAATGLLGGVLGGVLAALLASLLILVPVFLGGFGPESGDYSLGIGILSIFITCSLAGAAVGALARVIAVDLHHRRPG